MKKILTLMAAMSAASGAFAHDYNWDFTNLTGDDTNKALESLKVGDDSNFNLTSKGKVTITKNGLSFEAGSANYVEFTVQANDELTVSASGAQNGKFYVAIGNRIVETTLKDMTTLATNVGNETSIQVYAGEGVVITGITVQSETYRTLKERGEEIYTALQKRNDDISKYAENEQAFYLNVKKKLNDQGAELVDIRKDFDKAAANNTLANGGATELENSLNAVEAAVGTYDPKTGTSTDGNILSDAKTAYALYQKIVSEDASVQDSKVKDAIKKINDAQARTDKDYIEGSLNKHFYEKKENSEGIYIYEEKWPASKTASGVGALTTFKEYVENYFNELKAGAVEALANYKEIGEDGVENKDLETYATKFDEIGTRIDNIYKRYEWEEKVEAPNKNKNYDVVKNLKESVENMANFSESNKDLFDQTGLDNLKTEAKSLWEKVSDRTKMHEAQTSFNYSTLKGSIDAKKLAWGKAAAAALKKEYDNVQASLNSCQGVITTKFQNDHEKLQEYEVKFAKLQNRLNAIKDACNAIGNDPEKAYDVANKYAGTYVPEIEAISGEISDIWKDTQTTENKVIIEKNKKALDELKTTRDQARADYNKVVDRLAAIQSSTFFNGEYVYSTTPSAGEKMADLKDFINGKIKSIYDYSLLIEEAYSAAEKEVKEEYNKEGAEGEVVAKLYDTTEATTAISKNMGLINADLDAALKEVKQKAMTFFNHNILSNTETNKKFPNGLMFISEATQIIKNCMGDKNPSYGVRESFNSVKNTYPKFKEETAFTQATDRLQALIDGKLEYEKKADGTDDTTKKVYLKDAKGNFIKDDNSQNIQKYVTNNDIQNAKQEILVLGNELADDAAKDANGNVTKILSNTVASAKNIVAQLKGYGQLRQGIYDAQVAWSVNQARADKENAEWLQYLADLHTDLDAAEADLKEKGLDIDQTEFKKTLTALQERVTISASAESVRKAVANQSAAVEVQKAIDTVKPEIAKAKAELEKLSKDNAKEYLQKAINTANAAVVEAEAALTADDLAEQKDKLIKALNDVDLTAAIAKAKQLDSTVDGDIAGDDGVVDSEDAMVVQEAIESGVYNKAADFDKNNVVDSADWTIFLNYLKKYNTSK